MARGSQLVRQWELLRALQTRGTGIPLRELAERFEISERTLQRDFEMMQELGFPIEHDTDEQGKRYWRMPHDFFKNGPFVISLTEAISLHLAEEFLGPLSGTHLAEGLATLLDKIRKLLPIQAMSHFAHLDEILFVRRTGRTDYSSKAQIVQVLESCAREQISAEITYHALWRGEQYSTRVDPYGLVFYEGDLFLVGHSHRSDALRVFKVARIQAANESNHKFERPPDFQLEEHFRSSFGIVRSPGNAIEIAVRFRGAGAALVGERVWHESQRLNWPDDDGGMLFDCEAKEPEHLVATFKLTDVTEFKRWLLGFGSLAEVLRPAWLRSEIASDLAAAAESYASPGDVG